MKENDFIKALEDINIHVSINQLNQLKKYYEILVEWNKSMNLTGITEIKEVYLKHFYDSATMNQIIDLNTVESLCDVGSGAGFPGLVIKILFPHIKVVLIDSLNKRINFLNEVIKELELTEIIAIHTRSEEFGVKNKEQFDVVTARAVASLPILMEICVPLVKVNKYFIPMKANISDEEIKTSNACDKLSINIEEKIEFKLPFENSNRCLLKYKKIKETNKIYPRKYAEIKKKPL